MKPVRRLQRAVLALELGRHLTDIQTQQELRTHLDQPGLNRVAVHTHGRAVPALEPASCGVR